MSKIVIAGWIVGMVQTNVYYLHREGNAETILVDPADQGDALVRGLEDQGLKVSAMLLTHGHFDHIGGVADVRALTGAPVYICEKEVDLVRDAEANLSAKHLNPKTVNPDHTLRDGEKVTLADITLQCIWTPGHTGGSCCYYIEAAETGGDPFLLSGDTLFEESVGRTDFPTSSAGDIVRSVRDKLFVLPDNTQVFPGHGGMTTIGHEKQFNPCV